MSIGYFHTDTNKQVNLRGAPMDIQWNGKKLNVDASPDTPLLWVLRDHLGLTGTKYGCGMAQCGACTVYLDGAPIRSCVTPISAANGKAVTTIESISGPEIDALRSAWQELEVPQCGYCQSGQLMSAASLLKSNKKPSSEDIDSAMSGNICRCATYVRIKAGIQLAANRLGV
jgi:isoquinoline 1-oxidoreductase subunit alpha